MRVSVSGRVAIYVLGDWHRSKAVARQRWAAQAAANVRYRGFKTYMDADVPLVDRTAFLDMLTDLLDDRPKPQFFVESLATVFASYSGAELRRFLGELGIDVVEATPSLAPAIDAVSEERTRTHLAVFARRLIEHRKRRTEKRNRRSRGRKPFGSCPGEAETLKLIRSLRRKPRDRGKSRMSYADIAAHLNRLGQLTRSGVPWSAGSIARIVVREFPHLK